MDMRLFRIERFLYVELSTLNFERRATVVCGPRSRVGSLYKGANGLCRDGYSEGVV